MSLVGKVNVGTRIEFNTVIALRPWRPELATETIVPPENELCVAWGHPFRKAGHRVYEIGQLVPLLETKGNGCFTRVLGLVEVKYYGVEMTSNGVETFGEYVVKRVFNQKESDLWLQILNPSA